MFDLTIRTLQGSCKFPSVPPGLTVEEFKEQLHEAAATKRLPGLNIPSPERQNIVYHGRALQEGSLEEAGIQSGDSVVILFVPPPVPTSPQELSSGPSGEEIAAAIQEYAASHGLESKLTAPEKPRTRPRSNAISDRGVFGTEQLQVIIDALEESLGRRSAPNEAQNEGEEAEEEPYQVPEPDPQHMCSLTEEMGISPDVARKALLLHRNNITAALNWICEHADDEDVATPIPEAVLRSLYGRRRQQRRVSVRPEVLQQLVEMGFEEEEARSALSRTRNNLELAVASLVRQTRGRPAEETPPAAQSVALPSVSESVDADGLEPESSFGADPDPEQNDTEGAPNESVTVTLLEMDQRTAGGETGEAAIHAPPGLDWAHVEMEEAEDGPDEPPSSEINVSLVGDGEEEIIVGSSDLDQGHSYMCDQEVHFCILGELGGVSLEDVERALGGEGDSMSSRALYPQLRRLLEGIDLQLLESLPTSGNEDDEEAADGDAAAFLRRFRELLNVIGSNTQNQDPYGAGPSGEMQDNA